MKKLITLIVLLSLQCEASSTNLNYPEPKDYQVEKVTEEILIQERIPHKKICRAAIMAIMGYEAHETMSKQINKNTSAVMRYRATDDTFWNYICQINGGDILWAFMNPDGPQKLSAGRWRNHPDDEKISYLLDQENLTILIIDGASSETKKLYSLKTIAAW